MRILHIVPTYLPAVRYGGTIFSVHSLCRALASRNHEITVFTTNVDGAGISGVPLMRPVDIDGVHVKYFPSTWPRRLFRSSAMQDALKCEVANFDVIHLHSVFLWPTTVAARIARQKGIPYVVSPHGMLVKYLIQKRNRIIKTLWIRSFERKNLELAGAVHVASELEKSELMRFGMRFRRIAVLPHGVDDPQDENVVVSKDVAEIVSLQPLILFLGRLSWKKGLDQLIQALAVTKYAKLAIVGPDDEKLSASLMKRVENLKAGARVAFLSRVVSGMDREYLFRAAKLFVLPSYSENFGITVLEAMRRGLPVIVTPQVGAAEIVVKAGAGLVVPNDPEALSAAIRRLIADTSLMQKMGKVGRQYVLQHHGWPMIAAEMEGIYENVINDTGLLPFHSHSLSSS